MVLAPLVTTTYGACIIKLYLKACSRIVDTFGGNLMELVETKQNFMKKYSLEYVEIKIRAAYQV